MEPLSLNRYAYTSNNPVMNIDPSGHSSQTVIKKGSKETDRVKEVQRILVYLGYDLGTTGEKGVDGDFGEKTYEAVVDFQKKTSLKSTGEVESKTWAKLYELYNVSESMSTHVDMGTEEKINSSGKTVAKSSFVDTKKSESKAVSKNDVGCGGKEDIASNLKVTRDISLFLDSDFRLNPEVQQLITYYDDMYLYADVASELGIIDEWEKQALKSKLEEDAAELREKNKLKVVNNTTAIDVIFAVGGFIPYVGIVFDALSNPTTAYAATLDMSAMKKISDNAGKIESAIARSAKYNAKYTVYELVDSNNNVRYVGRTRQDIEVRKKQHWKADSAKGGFRIRAVEFDGKALEELSYTEARGLEQIVFEKYEKLYGGYNNEKFLNKIKPLDKTSRNPKVAEKAKGYLDDALEFLKKVK